MSEFRAELDETAKQISQTLAAKGPSTAWDLKMQIKVSHTRLHLALGLLCAQGKINLRPEKQTLRVEPVKSETSPARPEASATA